VNHEDDQNLCPLQKFASQGAEEMVQALVLAGANLNVGNAKAGTPLHLAVQRGSRAIIQHLLTAGATIDPWDTEHKTPLNLAMDTSRADLVSILLRHKANPFLWDREGVCAFHKLLYNGNPYFLREFKMYKHVPSWSLVMETKFLPFAVRQKNVAAAIIIMQFMELPCYDMHEGRTDSETGVIPPLHKAAVAFRHDIVDSLLSIGFAIHALDGQLRTAIQAVCRAGKQLDDQLQDERIQTIQRLLKAGANILQADKDGSSPVSIALEEDDSDLMMICARHWEKSSRLGEVGFVGAPDWYKRLIERLQKRTDTLKPLL
jgi:hypothetical protein